MSATLEQHYKNIVSAQNELIYELSKPQSSKVIIDFWKKKIEKYNYELQERQLQEIEWLYNAPIGKLSV